MSFALARKLEMSQRYDGDAAVPVTILEVLPGTVTQVRTVERDGYSAVQLAAGTRRHGSRALRGHFGKVPAYDRGDRGVFRWVREFRTSEPPDALPVGTRVDESGFAVGDVVEAIAMSKGKGFQGPMRRHHFHGQDASHGNKDQHRMPGSIGGGGRAGGRVTKGKRMAGRMGGERVTVRGLRVIAVDPATHRVEVCGAVPGARGGLVEVRTYSGYWEPTRSTRNLEQGT